MSARGDARGSRAAVVGIGALSPFGRGIEAYDVTKAGEKARVAIRNDEALALGKFSRTLVARVPDACLSKTAPSAVTHDRATHLLFDAAVDALADAGLATIDPAVRWGIAIGTSSGGMRTAETLFAAVERGEPVDPEVAREATYYAPFTAVIRELGIVPTRKTQLVTACAASTWAVGIALDWLRRGEVDRVLAGGYDAHSGFVQAGFDALRATSPKMPVPFRVGREGMALGEGAGILVLAREGEHGTGAPRFFVCGFGASTDAVHITAPDRTGGGLARASSRALEDASLEPRAIRVVSAHATATPYNDAMEAKAIHRVFGDADPVVMPFKGQIGHALGAAGILETLALVAAIERDLLPPAAGDGVVDEEARVRLLERATPSDARVDFGLKQSAAFGGANAALVVATPRAPVPRPLPRQRRTAHLGGFASVAAPAIELVARVSGTPQDRVARIDGLALLAATAVATVIAEVPRAPLGSAAVVAGHALATIDVNHRFHARVLAKGPTAAEPKLFPPTSPNLVAGHIAILFGMGGPSAAVCRGLDGGIEAFEMGIDLVASGAADIAVVVAVDDLSGLARHVSNAIDARLGHGATAALVVAEGKGGSLATPLVPAVEHGHRGFAELLAALGAGKVECQFGST